MRGRGLSRRALCLLGTGLAAGAAAAQPAGQPAQPTKARTTGRQALRADDQGADLVPFHQAPYPLPAGFTVPPNNDPFFTGRDEHGRFHDAPRGGRLYDATTYGDRRSLVVVPARFDPRRPAALVLFFHGNLATLSRDVVRRQRVVDQVSRATLNAVLVAPQLAVDALDSSPGRFYEAGFLDSYLDEAAAHLAARAAGTTADAFRALPVVLVAYSGGYLATAWCLQNPSAARERIAGVVLLDALFGEEAKFVDWAEREHRRRFLVSAYSASSAALNGQLTADLAARGVPVARGLPARLSNGVALVDAHAAGHNDFVTAAWTIDPLRRLLSLMHPEDWPPSQ